MDFLFIIFGITFLLTGFFSGFIAGLLGVGGGIIIVPITYFVLLNLGYNTNIIMHVAIASSLGVIVFTSLSSIYSHIKFQNIDFYVIKKWFLGIITGSLIGSYCASLINTYYLIIIFVTLLFLLSLNMFFQKKTIIITNEFPVNSLKNLFISNLVGFLSALIGIGGGSFSVPILSAYKKPIHKAVGTSACIGFFIAFPAVISYALLGRNISDLPPYSIGYVNLAIVFLTASTSIFSANIGAKLSTRTKTSTLKKIFAVFLFCTCISLIIEHFIY